MHTVTLPPDLARFAPEAVAARHYLDTTEVVRAGFEFLRRPDAARAAFVASLDAAVAEAERDGWYSLDDVLAEMDRIIEAAERPPA